MNSEEVARSLYAVTEGVDALYFKLDPEFPDWTVHGSGRVSVMSQHGECSIPFDRDSISAVASLLDVAVFTGKAVFAWNFKNFVSYVRHHHRKHREYDCRVFDLKIIEGFLDDRRDAPRDFAEAYSRVAAAASGNWKRVYREIHLPLLTRVVPALECVGIVDTARRRIAYAHYEIDRTPTGRLVCQLPGKGYNPHTLGADAPYKPPTPGDQFLYLDYRSMEVRVLQHLSGDPNLGRIIAEHADLYQATWFALTQVATMPPGWKSTFLAIFFGMGVEAISRRNHWSHDISREILRRMRETFPTAMDYGDAAQESARHAAVVDAFGRRRDLTSRPHVARNHGIQAAASVVCMEKLIQLHDNLPPKVQIAYSVHDGFCFFCDPGEMPTAIGRLVAILESPSAFCAGLDLKVAGKAGPRLGQMLPLPESCLRPS